MLEFNNIHKRFGDVRILNGVNFCLGKGFVDTLTEGGGSGKMTLIPIVSNLLKPSKGSIEFERIENWSIFDLSCQSVDTKNYSYILKK